MPRDTQLGEFLRARRAVTTPAQAGLLDAGPRRTPGLRREEVAMLACISTDYYIRLEQGRERYPSEQVIGALAQVFDLGPDATAHLYALAHPAMPAQQEPRVSAAATAEVSPHLIRLMHSWQGTPAFVMNRWMDVLAVNPLGAAFYRQGLHGGMKAGDNLLRLLFLDPASHEFYRYWEPTVRRTVAHLRATVGTDLADPRLAQLVGELSLQSDDFRRMWARYDVQAETSHTSHFRHGAVGELILNCDVFSLAGAPGQQLVTKQAAPGSPSAHALALLGQEAYEHDLDPGHHTRHSDAGGQT